MTGEARDAKSDQGPLDGITVLDASQALAGPFCSMQLGDLGADVIKVERPEVGDQTRGWHPPTYGESNQSSYFLSVNRNKRSITINLKKKQGREIFRRLARNSDIVLENFRVGQLSEWNLGFKELKDDNPGLVYCSISGYGEWGPDRDKPAYDIVIQAEGGMMSITGMANGQPVRVGVAIADIGAGMYATQAILAALLNRELVEEDRGQKIDISLLDGQVAWMSYMATQYFATGNPPNRMGSRHPNITPYQAFDTKDGYIIVAVSSEAIWSRFCSALDREDLTEDTRFETNSDRVEHRGTLEEILREEIRQLTTEEAATVFEKYDVPASPVKDMESVFHNQQVQARNMLYSVEHPTAGEVKMPGSPMHFSHTPTTLSTHPPMLGEHTQEILRELGYDGSDVQEFDENGVI